MSLHITLERCYTASWFNNELMVLGGEQLEISARIASGEGSHAFGDFIL